MRIRRKENEKKSITQGRKKSNEKNEKRLYAPSAEMADAGLYADHAGIFPCLL